VKLCYMDTHTLACVKVLFTESDFVIFPHKLHFWEMVAVQSVCKSGVERGVGRK